MCIRDRRYNGSNSVDELFSIIKGKYESIDSVVNCLGSIFLKPAHLTKEEDLDATLDINLKSSFFILKNATKCAVSSFLFFLMIW